MSDAVHEPHWRTFNLAAARPCGCDRVHIEAGGQCQPFLRAATPRHQFRISSKNRSAAGPLLSAVANWLLRGLDAERAMAWRAADALALREFLRLVLPEAPPDHSTIARTRRLIDLETHQAVFTWMPQRLAMPRDWSGSR